MVPIVLKDLVFGVPYSNVVFVWNSFHTNSWPSIKRNASLEFLNGDGGSVSQVIEYSGDVFIRSYPTRLQTLPSSVSLVLASPVSTKFRNPLGVSL
jgi:hypothetical protein